MHLFAFKNNTNNWTMPRLTKCGYIAISNNQADSNGFEHGFISSRDVSIMHLN